MGIFNQNQNPNNRDRDPYQRGGGGYPPNQAPPGRGFKARLLGALLIAIIGLAMFYFKAETNPITGESQHVSISPAEEVKLGLQSAPEMARQMGGEVSSNDPRAQEVNRIGQYILSKTIKQEVPWKFKFHLLADKKTINAFALPGGQIFITEGLLDKLQTEAQLAGVLSHEMGHVIERHAAQQMAKSDLGKYLATAVGAAASDDPNTARSATQVAFVVNQMVQLRYSRHDESQADEWGVKLMTQAGYDPRAMIQVLEILKSAAGGSEGSDFFKSHPNPDLRIKQVEAYLKEHPPEPGLSEGKNLREVFGSGYGYRTNEQNQDSFPDHYRSVFR